MKTKQILALLIIVAALFSACNKNETNVKDNTTTLTTTNAVGSTVKLRIDAAVADQSGVWIDLNNNGKQDADETTVTFANDADYKLGSQTIILHGKISGLYCGSNKLTQLNLSDNPALVELYCDRNQLTTLEVTSNTALQTLSVSENNLKNLDLSKNEALKSLNCSTNQLTTLNLNINTALIWLNCTANQLNALDISKNTALTKLFCSNNQLTALDLSKNTALIEFWCEKNQIKAGAMRSLLLGLPKAATPAKAYIWYKPDLNENPTTMSIFDSQLLWGNVKDANWTLYKYNGTVWVVL